MEPTVHHHDLINRSEPSYS